MVKAMHADPSVPFWISENKVVLSEGLADGSIPVSNFRWVLDYQKKKFLHQAPIKFICVYDFECTCTNDEANPINSHEVIEFPIVIIDVEQKAVVAEFQTYVKPELDPQLTPFCTELTGITQEQVDAGVPLSEALNQAHAFLEAQGLFAHEFVFMSCGDFDGNHLKRESTTKNLTVPNYMRRWINFKKVFPMHLIDESVTAPDFTSATGLKKINKPVVHGMEHMLELVGL